MKKRLLSILLVGAMVFSFAACGAYEDAGTENGSDSEESTASGDEAEGEETASSGEKIFRYSEMTEPTTIDPGKADSIIDNEIIHAVQEGLVRNTAGEITPGIAESWEVSDDGLTYTFHLREAYWSDGVQVTGKDFVYGLQRLLNPDTASEYAFIGEYVKNGYAVETGEMDVTELGVSAPDDSTVVIELENQDIKGGQPCVL